MRRLWTWALLFLAGIVVGCAVAPRLTPITDPTQRLQFQGFSILPPTGKGWFKVEPPPQVNPSLTAKAYFIKRLTEGVTPPSELHRVTAVVRTLSLGDVKFENRTELLQHLAREFSEKSFLDKCLGWDCARYEFTSEDPSHPQFPGFVFVIRAQGFVVLHPDSPRFVINLEYRQYYARGQQPLSAEALETEVEPFQKSLFLTPLR